MREAGIREPILLLEGFFQPEDLEAVAELGIIPAVHRLEHEFGAKPLLEPLSYSIARRVEKPVVAAIESKHGTEVLEREGVTGTDAVGLHGPSSRPPANLIRAAIRFSMGGWVANRLENSDLLGVLSRNMPLSSSGASSLD